jgi:hypothetical protein
MRFIAHLINNPEVPFQLGDETMFLVETAILAKVKNVYFGLRLSAFWKECEPSYLLCNECKLLVTFFGNYLKLDI